MSRAVVVGAGSCLLEAIVAGLHRLPRSDDEAELHLSQLGADGRASVPEDVLARCTVLIEEACPLRRQFTLSETERALLPADCATNPGADAAHELALAADDRTQFRATCRRPVRLLAASSAPVRRQAGPSGAGRNTRSGPAHGRLSRVSTCSPRRGLPRRTNSGCRTASRANTAATSALPPTCCTISASCGCSTRTATRPGG